jgi:hypothetical protein
MPARPAQGLDRRSFVRLPLKEQIMRRSLYIGCAVLTLIAISHSTYALAQDAKGKNCHMEQQCHWQNFKKICVWVKVCR